ncbi:MAG: putative nucleotidyltransferase component of viral defense system [Polaribacter sp.]|jgi:predicted nucleotidyltransferase component of viral defense system
MDTNSIYYKQVQLLMSVLPTVAKQPCFALKGGTAINLFVRNLPRLSVDIDLTYLDQGGREESLAKIKQAMQGIQTDLQKRGLVVSESQKTVF